MSLIIMNKEIGNGHVMNMTTKRKQQPYALKHKDHELTIMNGRWGPHTKRVVCLTCGGAFVMWAKKSR